ncbi:MAG: sigma-54-dependent Fis family transcriptional regulator [Thermoanaerobaculaceae bacterium]|nr:sigma-54-dependent Fis family transcriptional regulator [Thermoanaerobaculaceae bacterium]
MNFGILVVDDDEEILGAIEKIVQSEERRVFTAQTLNEANLTFDEESVDLVISDLVLPDGSGIDLLKKVKKINDDIPFVLVTGNSTVDTAVEALKSGATDYITKPFRAVELKTLVENILNKVKIIKENESLKEEILRLKGYEQVVGKSKAMQEILKIIEKVKDIDATVLITGESGTGKEVIARLLHQRSKRNKNPFVAINCGAIPDALIEDELFGHVKGAFTDAVAPRVGAFEKADGGILFLDEIGTLRMDLQVKLLRVIQSREFAPIGSTNVRKVDVRIMAATNSNLQEMVREGKFREDLYYRLNIIHIQIPPLRERREDILPLLRFAMEKISLRLGTKPKDFSRSALEAMLNYDYRGNVRELENIVERSLALSEEDKITLNDLPEEVKQKKEENLSDESKGKGAILSYVENNGLDAYLQRIEKKVITEALLKCNYRKSKAALLLKIQRTTLVERMKRLNIPLRKDNCEDDSETETN